MTKDFDYLRILRERWWMIVVAAVVAVAVALALSAAMTPKYRATAQMMSEDSNLDAAFLGTPLYRTATQDRDVLTGARLVKLAGVAESVKERLGSSRSPAELLDMISVDTRADSNVIEVSAVGSDPTEAAAVADTFVAAFVDQQKTDARALVAEAQTVVRETLSGLSASEAASEYGLMLKDKLEQLSIVEHLQSGGFRIVQRAVVPLRPYSPDYVRNGMVALALGLIFGFGLAFAVGYFDRRIKTAEALEKEFGLPVLTYVPDVGRNHGRQSDYKNQPAQFLSRQEALSEPFRMLRANLRYFDLDHRIACMLVTSALPQEGKTTTVVNLAFSMALAGERVIIVEADLRRPSLHKYLGLSNSLGVTNVLSGSHSIAEVLQQFQVDPGDADGGRSKARTDSVLRLHKNMYVVTSGPLPPNPGELLASPRMGELIRRAGESADFVLVDSPPLLLVADGLALVGSVDGVLLTARVGRTTIPEAHAVRQLVERTGVKLIGVVATGVKPSSAAGYYGYGERYGY